MIKSRRLRRASHLAKMEEGRSGFKILTCKPTGKSSVRIPRRRLEDNIKINLKEMGINTRNWVDSSQDMNFCRVLVNAVLNHRVS